MLVIKCPYCEEERSELEFRHAGDAHIAFDAAAERIDKQLRRYMRRLKDRHSPAAGRTAPPLAEGGMTTRLRERANNTHCSRGCERRHR